MLWWVLPYMSAVGVHVSPYPKPLLTSLPTPSVYDPLGHPRAPVLSAVFHALNLDCSLFRMW